MALLDGPPIALAVRPVSTVVNSPTNDDPRCLEPPEPVVQTDGPLFETVTVARARHDV